MSNQPETTVIPDGNGGFSHVPGTQAQPGPATAQRHPLAGHVDMVAAGLPITKDYFSDTWESLPFVFKLRPVSTNIRLADDDFSNHIIAELGLEALAEKLWDFSKTPDAKAAIRNNARALLENDGFRADHPELSIRADRLVKEKYLQVILGMTHTEKGEAVDDTDPLFWGGLAGWTLRGVDQSEYPFPFTSENVRLLSVATLLDLYERILNLSRSGFNSQRFRRITG